MGKGFFIKVDGLRQLEKAFDEAPKKLKAAQKRAARLSMTILSKKTKQKAPKVKKRVSVMHDGQQVKLLQYGQTGALKKAIGPKVGVNKKSGEVYGLVGIRRDVKMIAWKAWGTKGKPHRIVVKPTAYAHLIEFGHKLRGMFRGPDVPAHPFMRPAFDSSKGRMESKIIETMREEIAKF